VEYLVSLSMRRKYIVIVHISYTGCYIYFSILWQDVVRAAIARILVVP